MALSIKPTRRDLVRMANQRANEGLEREIEELDRRIVKSQEQEHKLQQQSSARHSAAGAKAHAVMLAKMRAVADELGLHLSVQHFNSENVVKTNANLSFTGEAKTRRVKSPSARLTKLLADRKHLLDRRIELALAKRDLADRRGEWELLNEFATGEVSELLDQAAQVLAAKAKQRTNR